ncbi:membrane-associated protease RseP (regulator of RpoE activity) [Granulicella aggregans]|uniref:Membrane-associated protease RseP (Regulator of RpoE activity) n=1 Tax=Granulicella aggregans TaxID=474949 RepID=A0A7W7ZCX5_9BACT|nr:site-2 protease family protein [Granulicella aggregans]MBB5057585.1 membrane-associated protease RseP (regulator of RpoE activity) [Granulicella aggregans]
MFDFQNGQPPLTSTVDLIPFAWAWHHLRLVTEGLPFSLTLFAIFGAHRLGHYFARRLLGTSYALGGAVPAATSYTEDFGNFGRRRSRPNSRAETIAIGAAGPVAGFVVAVAATCYGLTHSASIDAHANVSLLRISAPALIGILRSTMLASYPDIPPVLQMLPHPVLVAAWSGLLLTALTLIPAGRLDGGHILYALSPRLHRIISACSIGAVLYLGTVEWIGWLFLALVLVQPSTKYFRSRDRTPLSVEWLVVVPLCLAIFLLTVSTQPITGMSLTRVLLRIHRGF